MGGTHFSGLVYSAGIPILGTLPPIIGQYYFVCPGYPGASNGNSGKKIDRPLADLETAYGKCTDGAGDGIVHVSYGTTTAQTTSYLSAALTWSKSNITTVGICAPTSIAQRARISTAEAALASLITVSGSNNSFYNLHLYNGGTTGTGCLVVTGDRNYFYNVHAIGAGGVTAAADGDNDLTLTGASENTFERCVFGSDTKDRGDKVSAGIHFTGGCMRNRFYDCETISYHSTGTDAGAISVDSAGAGITRDVVFKNCLFTVYDEANAAAETGVVIGTVPNNGRVLLMNCMMNGFADWNAVADTGICLTNMAAAADTGGKALEQNAS